MVVQGRQGGDNQDTVAQVQKEVPRQKAPLLESDQREDRSKVVVEEEIAEDSKFEAADRSKVEMAGRE